MAAKGLLRVSKTFLRLNPIRNSGYIASKLPEDPSCYTDVEPVKNVDWKYVERLLPRPKIPDPPSQNTVSGWIAPKANTNDLPYFVLRSRNHQPPVYLDISHRGQRRLTVIKRIRGDLWALEADLREYLTPHVKTLRLLEIQVHELACKVTIHGDYVALVLKWFHERGF